MVIVSVWVAAASEVRRHVGDGEAVKKAWPRVAETSSSKKVNLQKANILRCQSAARYHVAMRETRGLS